MAALAASVVKKIRISYLWSAYIVICSPVTVVWVSCSEAAWPSSLNAYMQPWKCHIFTRIISSRESQLAKERYRGSHWRQPHTKDSLPHTIGRGRVSSVPHD